MKEKVNNKQIIDRLIKGFNNLPIKPPVIKFHHTKNGILITSSYPVVIEIEGNRTSIPYIDGINVSFIKKT